MNYHRLAGVVWAFTLAGIISGMTLLPGWRSEAAAQEVNGLTLSAQVGLDGYCRKGDWIPIRVTIGNPGPDLGARVKVAYREKITYASDILLPAASNRRLFLYAYDQNFYRDLVVILEDGKTILAQEELSVTCLSDSYRLI